jgi:thiol:disulfide interchange protein DsbC
MKIVSVLFVVASLLSSIAHAGPANKLSGTEIREKLGQASPELPIKDVAPSVLAGFYEVTLEEGTTLFVSEDGNHFLAGDLYRIDPGTFVNVSEERRNGSRRELIAAVDEADMLIFSPPEGMKKTSISVFTDIDCGYCRKLHKEVPELNRLGVEVRYLAYPRAGIDSESFDKYVSAFCAENPKLALTQAKMGQEVEASTCVNPIAAQYLLGNQIGVRGTPAIIYEDGTLMPGYLPAPELASRLGIN